MLRLNVAYLLHAKQFADAQQREMEVREAAKPGLLRSRVAGNAPRTLRADLWKRLRTPLPTNTVPGLPKLIQVCSSFFATARPPTWRQAGAFLLLPNGKEHQHVVLLLESARGQQSKSLRR